MSWLKRIVRAILSMLVREGKKEGWIDPNASKGSTPGTKPNYGGPPR